MSEPAALPRSRRRILDPRAAADPFASRVDISATSPSMRGPNRRAPGAVRGAAPSLPPLSVIAYNRMAFGPRQGDLAAFNALGGNDDARLTAFVDQQLAPAGIDDSELDAALAAGGFTTLGKTLQELWTDHHLNDLTYDEHIQPIRETISATWLRARYSRRQLVEVLADFWHNHFNVFGWEYRLAPIFVHYDRDVIRANVLGNFRTLLGAVASSTAMLYYLDNYTSSNAGPNENFSRELFELHTLGAENYLGVMQQNVVPLDGDGFPLGYVDNDIFETTRCFTGWTVDSESLGNTGGFAYRADWHDRFQKNVLGMFVPSDQADLKDGNDVLDRLVAHPGTGRHIARKLCRRLIADEPPQAVVDAAAAVFTAQKDAPDQIAQVVRTILLSSEFRTTWGEKTKRPFEIIASALRAAEATFNFRLDNGDTGSFDYRYGHTGQDLFSHPAPNGYPDTRAAWASTTPRAQGWRMVNWLVDATDGGGLYYLDIVGQTPPGTRSAEALADFWIQRILGRAMPAAERQEIVGFMAQGFNPSLDLPLDTDENTRERLRAMVGLIFMSPEFLWR